MEYLYFLLFFSFAPISHYILIYKYIYVYIYRYIKKKKKPLKKVKYFNKILSIGIRVEWKVFIHKVSLG